MLGFVFKASKDVESESSMVFLGYEIDITAGEVRVRTKDATRLKLRDWLSKFS